ncbi:MAG: HRDC domain-containing protein [Tepidisphaeraceae bacterium]
MPPYVICHDRTLKLIAAAVPTTEGELSKVKGMGPMKVKLYGDALIAAVTGDAVPGDMRVVYDEPLAGDVEG